MQSVGKLFESPYTALFVAILFGAIALSGKFNVTLTQVGLVAAWVIALFGLRSLPIPIIVGLGAIIGGILFLLAYHFKPEVIPQHFGLLTPNRKMIFSAGANKTPTETWIRALQIGDSETILVQIAGSKEPLLKLPNGCFFELEIVDGQLKVSTIVRDKQGNVVAEIIRNEWKASKAAWDRNYSDDAFEIRDAAGHVVLQVRLYQDRVQLLGEWWGTDGTGARIIKAKNESGKMVGAFEMLTPSYNPPNPIEPLFEYPSETHLGQFRTAK